VSGEGGFQEPVVGPPQPGRGSPGDEGARLGAAAVLLAGSVLLSRVIGYLREVALANQVGAGPETDAYYAAFQIPDLLNYLLAGGALSIAFLPLYTRVRNRRGEEAGEKLFATVLGGLGVATALATALLWMYAVPLIALQFPAFDPATRALTVRLTRIVLPAQIFFVTGGIVRAVLMADGRFLAHALAPLFYNGCIIAGGLLTGTAEGFAWGVLVGAFLGPFAVPIGDLLRHRRLRLRLSLIDPDFRSYLVIALPLMLGLSLATVDEWYGRWFGASLGAGIVAYLGFARRLVQAPVAIVGQAIATAALPTLAHLWSLGRREELDRTLLRTLQGSLSLAFLAAAACAVLADPLVEILYRHGRFTGEDAVRVAGILSVMSFAVPGWVTQQVAVRAFYAREDTWRPMLLGTGVAVAAIPLYLALRDTWGARGLAAAGALGITANALVTLGWARWLHGGPDLGAFARGALRSATIAALAGGAALLACRAVPGEGRVGALLDLGAGGAAFAGMVALGVAWIGDETTRALGRRLLGRLRLTRGRGR
jgi:putative peptidoglycan lipid II flippase